ncbi:11044_t:CDS:2 [Acaulospora morrowiae]|uniref:DASH complex subunit DAM1 n=1 Tax=Acaulospora morrowiae TaxID=94023 RepID=A0A9N9B8I0_9GLOM|nr:11044_t:CDS:2 [Acaulospora morrowiae]
MNFSLSIRAAEQHRRISRGYNLKSSTTGVPRNINDSSPLDCLEETLQELGNSFVKFQEDFSNVKQVHESLVEFNKSFSSFLYGVKMNAHCIEFSEAPTMETLASLAQRHDENNKSTPVSTPIPNRKTITPMRSLRKQTTGRKTRTPATQLGANDDSKVFKTPTQPPPKKRKVNKALAIKTLIKKIVDSLPPKYRDQQQVNRKNIEIILKLLCDKPLEGKYMEDIIKLSNLTRSRCTEYLNVLVNAKHAVKLSQKGQLFKLDPGKYSTIA